MMTAKLSWYIPGRIIYVPGTLSKEEISERNHLILQLIETEGQPPHVHVLIDHSNRYTPEELHTQLKPFTHYLKSDDEETRRKLAQHPLLGWVLSIANPSAGMKMGAAVSSQKLRYRWHNVDTMEEAFDFLLKRDSTLKDLLAKR